MQLPVLNPTRPRPARLFHVLRLLLVLLLLVGLHRLGTANRRQQPVRELSLADVQSLLPEAKTIVQRAGSTAMWDVLDKDQACIATAMMTSPEADEVVGYAGPSNLMLLLNGDGRVSRASLLSSSDTVDHVSKVSESPAFWQQFEGRAMGESQAQAVDGVSGATLTSLAIAEAIDMRLRGQRTSLRFPDELTIEEIKPIWPAAVDLKPDPERAGFAMAMDDQGKLLGYVFRTGPIESGVVGYQGPSEVIIAVDERDVIQKVRFRKSFDNDPYTRYTRMEASFWAKFVGRSLAEIGRLDIEAEGIEGVSGATMTSMAVVETIKRVASKLAQEAAERQRASDQATGWAWSTLNGSAVNWSVGELATLLLALLVVPWSLSSLRGQRWLRRLWQWSALLVIVILSGNLISIALLAGWTSALPRWSLAPGLVALVVVSIASPALLGRNVYCDHVCPHGIAQQWLARRPLWLRFARSKRTNEVPKEGMAAVAKSWRKNLHRVLHASALLVIILGATWIIWRQPAQLTIFEPFDVYAWRVGLSSSLLVWCLSLLLAAKEPMGYCRLACPTGKLLDGIRWKRTGGRLAASDMLLGLMTVIVWWAAV